MARQFEGKVISCSNAFGMGKIEVVDLFSGLVQTMQMSGPYCCASSKRWKVYAIASYGEKCAFVLSHDNDLAPLHFVDHSYGVYAVTLANNRPHVISGDGAGIIKITDFVARSPVHQIHLHTSLISDLFVSSDDEVLMAASADCRASVVTLDNVDDVMVLEVHPCAVSAIILLTNGLSIVTGASDGSLRCFNSITGELMLTRFYHTRVVNALTAHPDGALMASGSADKTIALWSTDDLTPLGAIPCSSCVGSLVFMGHSHILLAGVFTDGVLAYDCMTGDYIQTVSQHRYAVWGVAFDDSLPVKASLADPFAAANPVPPAYRKSRVSALSYPKPEMVIPKQTCRGSVELFAPVKTSSGRLSWTGRRSGSLRTSSMPVDDLPEDLADKLVLTDVRKPQRPRSNYRNSIIRQLPRLKSSVGMHVQALSASKPVTPALSRLGSRNQIDVNFLAAFAQPSSSSSASGFLSVPNGSTLSTSSPAAPRGSMLSQSDPYQAMFSADSFNAELAMCDSETAQFNQDTAPTATHLQFQSPDDFSLRGPPRGSLVSQIGSEDSSAPQGHAFLQAFFDSHGSEPISTAHRNSIATSVSHHDVSSTNFDQAQPSSQPWSRRAPAISSPPKLALGLSTLPEDSSTHIQNSQPVVPPIYYIPPLHLPDAQPTLPTANISKPSAFERFDAPSMSHAPARESSGASTMHIPAIFIEGDVTEPFFSDSGIARQRVHSLSVIPEDQPVSAASLLAESSAEHQPMSLLGVTPTGSRRGTHVFNTVTVTQRPSLIYAPPSPRRSSDQTDESNYTDEDGYADLAQWEQEALFTPLSEWTVDDVRVLCIRQNLDVDDYVLQQHQVDGPKLLKFKNAATLMKLIGGSAFGDATFLMDTVWTLQNEMRFLDPRAVSAERNETSVSKWNLEQTCEWLLGIGLASLQDVFASHRISGDVLLQLDFTAFALADDSIHDALPQLKTALADLRQHDAQLQMQLEREFQNRCARASALAVGSSSPASPTDSP